MRSSVRPSLLAAAAIGVAGVAIAFAASGREAATPATTRPWDSFDPASLAALLFPEASRWTVVEKLPKVPPSRVQQLRDPLTRRYLEIAESRRGSEADCSILDGILDAGAGSTPAAAAPPRPGVAASPADFRSLDVDGDKQADIVFTGANPCAEGSVSLVFFAPFDDEQVRAADFLPYRLLRVRTGQETRYLGFQNGCCDDPSSRFFVGTRMAPTGATIRVSRALILPARLGAPPHAAAGAAAAETGDAAGWTAAGEATLRSSPEILDVYDTTESAHRDAAVFGNVLSKYLAGARGRLIATSVAPTKETWGLVLIDPSSRALAVHAPFDSDLGWVELSPSASASPSPSPSPAP